MSEANATSRTRSLVGKTWLRVLVVGIGLWVLQLVVYAVTRDVVLLPGILVLGSAIVPLGCVVWFANAEQRVDGQTIDVRRLAVGFLCGGLIAVPFAVILENGLLLNTLWLYFPGIALVEETAKLGVVWLVASGLAPYTRRKGMVLGAAVGFGFAAFETAGISLDAVLQNSNDAVRTIAITEIVRSIESPFGHGLWTALVGGALFAAAAAAGRDKVRITRSVLGWLLVAIVLHCLWDMTGSWASVLATVSTGNPVDWNNFDQGNIINATSQESTLETIYGISFKILVMAVGALIAIKQWKRDAPRKAERTN